MSLKVLLEDLRDRVREFKILGPATAKAQKIGILNTDLKIGDAGFFEGFLNLTPLGAYDHSLENK